MTNRNDEALRALVENAMRKAFQLGQTYWQQADSDSYKENRKSGETMERFRAHLSETLAALIPRPEPAGRDKSAKTHKDGRDKSPDLHKDVTPGVTLVDFYGWRGKIVNHREAAEAAAHAPQEGAE